MRHGFYPQGMNNKVGKMFFFIHERGMRGQGQNRKRSVQTRLALSEKSAWRREDT